MKSLKIGGNSGRLRRCTLPPGSTLSASRIGIVIFPAGALTGSGAIVGSVINQGRFARGFSGRYPDQGDYTRSSPPPSTSRASADYDGLSVLGIAHLAGTINVSMLTEFVPHAKPLTTSSWRRRSSMTAWRLSAPGILVELPLHRQLIAGAIRPQTLGNHCDWCVDRWSLHPPSDLIFLYDVSRVRSAAIILPRHARCRCARNYRRPALNG